MRGIGFVLPTVAREIAVQLMVRRRVAFIAMPTTAPNLLAEKSADAGCRPGQHADQIQDDARKSKASKLSRA